MVALRETERSDTGESGGTPETEKTEVTKMSKSTWMQWVFAAIMVILAGALIASAEERIEIRVEADGGDEISVDVNGVTEVVRLDDLADGESRYFDVGDHQMEVRRVGDELTIVNDGHAFGSIGNHKTIDTNIWVTDEGENIEIDGAHKMIMVKAGGCEDCDEGDCEGHAKAYTIRVDGDDVLLDEDGNVDIETIIATHGGHGAHGAVFVSEDGNVHHPSMMGTHQWHSDMVTYRCEESGSTLMVKKDDAFEDVYICPATGCVMTKVEEPELRVITMVKTIEIEDEE